MRAGVRCVFAGRAPAVAALVDSAFAGARRAAATAAKAAVPTASKFEASVVDGGVQLVDTSDAQKRKYWLAPEWLQENSTTHRFQTGQSTITLETIARDCGRVIDAKLAADGSTLTCTVTTAPEGAGLTAPDEDAAKQRTVFEVPLAAAFQRYGGKACAVSQPSKPVTSAKDVVRITFAELTAAAAANKTSAARKNFFTAMTRDGIVLVTDCPTADSRKTVDQLAHVCAPVSGMAKTLYGTDFKVNRDPGAEGPRNNIAYSGIFLDVHCDLAYHESMPGIQMLLCVAFDDAVKGGESFFVDAFAAAEELRETRPDAFDVLCRIPRMFCKDDASREVPAAYYFGAPHISVNELTGHVKKVVWAPSFEAPLPAWMPEGTKRQYYEARRAFAAVLLKWRKEHAVHQRLRPGECFIWNQVRLLHGREAFDEPRPGLRTLHGCYCNIDDFASEARAVLKADLPPVALGNGSWL